LHACSHRERLGADFRSLDALGGGRQRLPWFLHGLHVGLDLRDAGGRHLQLDRFATESLEAVAGSWPGTRRSGNSSLRREGGREGRGGREEV